MEVILKLQRGQYADDVYYPIIMFCNSYEQSIVVGTNS